MRMDKSESFTGEYISYNSSSADITNPGELSFGKKVEFTAR